MNCGIRHIQNSNTYEVECDQLAYIAALKPIVHTLVSSALPECALTPELLALFVSLLGAVAYALLTRWDIAVYVSALQRAGSKATIIHIRRLNAVVRWIQRNPKSIVYARLSSSSSSFTKLVGISDSAFKREGDEGHAMRGALIARMSGDPDHLASGPVHLLEDVCSKQKHVVRATFSAELFQACDTTDLVISIAQAIHEITVGRASPSETRRLREVGGFANALWIVVDANSVFAAITVLTQPRTPTEKSLLGHLLFLRELLDKDVLHGIAWVDTRDMVSDGLTKGSVNRAALHELFSGKWTIHHPHEEWRSSRPRQPNPTDAD